MRELLRWTSLFSVTNEITGNELNPIKKWNLNLSLY